MVSELPPDIREAVQHMRQTVAGLEKIPARVADVDQKVAESARFVAKQIDLYIKTRRAEEQFGDDSDERQALFYARVLELRNPDRETLLLIVNHLVEVAAYGLKHAWGGTWEQVQKALDDPDLPFYPDREDT